MHFSDLLCASVPLWFKIFLPTPTHTAAATIFPAERIVASHTSNRNTFPTVPSISRARVHTRCHMRSPHPDHRRMTWRCPKGPDNGQPPIPIRTPSHKPASSPPEDGHNKTAGSAAANEISAAPDEPAPCLPWWRTRHHRGAPEVMDAKQARARAVSRC